MKPRALRWMLLIVWCIWFLPWQAKSYWPETFGDSSIQWGSTLVTALLLPAGFFLSIHALLKYPKERVISAASVLGFGTLYGFILGFCVLVLFTMPRAYESIGQFSSQRELPGLLAKLERSSSPEKRELIARAIYWFSGISVSYEAEEGIYRFYQPTDKDRETWRQTAGSERKIGEVEAMLKWQLVQMPYILALYVATFWLTLVAGILIILFKKDGTAPGPP